MMITTLIKMVNVDVLSSQNVNCSLSNSHTLVDPYLFMWRETVDLRVAEWIVCLVNFHYLANDKEKGLGTGQWLKVDILFMGGVP